MADQEWLIIIIYIYIFIDLSIYLSMYLPVRAYAHLQTIALERCVVSPAVPFGGTLKSVVLVQLIERDGSDCVAI